MPVLLSGVVTLGVLIVIGIGLLIGIYYGRVRESVVLVFLMISLPYIVVIGDVIIYLDGDITDSFNTMRLVLLTLIGCVFYMNESMEKDQSS